MNKLIFAALVLLGGLTRAQQPSEIAIPGQPLPAWREGYLDLHHINTGRGNAAFYILPDGTSVLFDAGELDPSDPRTTSKRNTPIRPDDSRKPYEWIANYIRQVAPVIGAGKGNAAAQATGAVAAPVIDYAVISHFHDDHFGAWYPGIPLSADKKFSLTGITGVGELLPIRILLTRDYNYPVSVDKALGQLPRDNHYVRTWDNYMDFIRDLWRRRWPGP